MVRKDQVQRIRTAVREMDKAMRGGSRQEQERCYAVLEAVRRNSSSAEINAAIEW